MEHLRQHSEVAQYIGSQLVNESMTVVDIGCSGGLDNGWRSFGSRLAAVGIDPSISEITRLKGMETNPACQYFAGFAGAPKQHPLRALSGRYSWWRRNFSLGLAAFAKIIARDGGKPAIPAPVIDYRGIEQDEQRFIADANFGWRYAPDGSNGLAAVTPTYNSVASPEQLNLMAQNLWHRAELADQEKIIVVSDLLADLNISNVDFIKIDVDGPDYEILSSCESLLSSAQVLGVAAEVNFLGSGAGRHHTFHNTDKFMRDAGFDLFGLTVRKYSSSALPARFLGSIVGQSEYGRPFQGDAIYIRDFGAKTAFTDADQFSDEKLLKTVALFSLFDLPDQAAEVVLRFQSRINHIVEVEHLLNLLALQIQSARATPSGYNEYMKEFWEDNPWFYS